MVTGFHGEQVEALSVSCGEPCAGRGDRRAPAGLRPRRPARRAASPTPRAARRAGDLAAVRRADGKGQRMTVERRRAAAWLYGGVAAAAALAGAGGALVATGAPTAAASGSTPLLGRSASSGRRAATLAFEQLARQAAAAQLLGHLVSALRRGDADARRLLPRKCRQRLASGRIGHRSAQRGAQVPGQRTPVSYPDRAGGPARHRAGQATWATRPAACRSPWCSTPTATSRQRKMGKLEPADLAGVAAGHSSRLEFGPHQSAQLTAERRNTPKNDDFQAS